MSHPASIVLEAPLVASPNQTMIAIQVSRKKLYELINSGELESYTEGKSRRITVKSINEYIERRLAAEAGPPRPLSTKHLLWLQAGRRRAGLDRMNLHASQRRL